MLADRVFWRLMLFYTHLWLLLKPSMLWLSIVTFNIHAKPPPKWILREFDISRIRPRLRGLPHLETFTWYNLTPAERVTGLADRATRLGWSPHLSCNRDQIKMRDYMDRRVTPPKRVISPTWGPPPTCKQALSTYLWLFSTAISRQFLPALSVNVMLAFLDKSSFTISTCPSRAARWSGVVWKKEDLRHRLARFVEQSDFYRGITPFQYRDPS